MQSFALTIIGIAAISILIDIIMPNGRISKYIKGIYAVFTVLIITSSIINLINKDFNINDYAIYESDVIKVNEKALEAIIISGYENKIERAIDVLERNNYKNVSIDIEYMTASPYEIKGVYVNIENILTENKTENIKDDITELVALVMLVDKGRVHIYGKG